MIDKLNDILKQLGVSESILFLLAILALVFAVISAIVKFIHWAVLKNKQWLLNENLHPYFSTSDVDRATRYYVPTRFQNVSPTADDEPGKTHLASAKQLLMPMFLNKAFKNNRNNTKYYLILADAGMGKTTFMVNLYLGYVSRPLKNLFRVNEDQGMKLFPLGSPDIWKDIEKIENKRDTILLLDAFDEDVKAVDNYDARMKEILETTKEFKQIVITCRTQFFPSDKEIPDDTGYTTFGGEQESYKFQRVYLSVFDESDINKYLKKRFSFVQRSKREKAFEVVEKSPNLVMRPMLLSYINDFVEADKTFNYTYEIYEVLIDKWIERESKKHGIRKKYGSEEKYRELLLDFSQTLAINLYEKRVERNGYFITKDDFIKDSDGFQITDLDNYGMTETEVRSKSLLNRNAEGKYKFSHKSIFEYFLSKELIQNGKLFSTFDFDGMSATEMFLDEMIIPYKNFKGTFEYYGEVDFQLSDKEVFHLLLSKKKSFSFIHLTAKIIPKVKSVTIYISSASDLYKLTIFTEMKELHINHKGIYLFLYDLYLLFFYYQELIELELRFKEMTQMKWRERREFITENEKKELVEKLERLKLAKTEEMMKRLEQLDLPELFERFKLMKRPESKDIGLKLFRLSEYFRGQKHKIPNLETLFVMKDDVIIQTLQPIEDFLKDMKLLQEKLPNCKMIY